MTKPVIAWAVRREWGRYYIIGLTRLDKFYFYGRESDGRRTSGTVWNLMGKFATEVEAREAAARHSAVLANYKPEIDRCRRALEQVQTAAREEADAALLGERGR